MSRFLAIGIVLCASLETGNCTIHHVPADYQTIQAAFDAIADGDTVLVALGTYVEALTAPARTFVLKGDVEPDTGDYERPIIDPSELINSRTLGCLLLPTTCHIVIEDMGFRNGAAMYPHEPGFHGGIRSYSLDPVFRRCVWDSTYYGIAGGPCAPTVEACRFVDVQGLILVPWRAVHATDCYFSGQGELLHGTPGSVYERCVIECSSTGPTFVGIDTNIVIRDCVFRNFSHPPTIPISLFGFTGIVEGCLFTGGEAGTTVMEIQAACTGGETVIRRNTFAGNTGNDAISLICLNGHDGFAALIDSNVFVDCSTPGIYLGKAIYTEATCAINSNRFVDLEPDEVAAVYVAADSVTMTGNYFTRTGFAVNSGGGGEADARLNWWGDATGPYNRTQNPGGLGDAVSDGVLFDPWIIDTTSSLRGARAEIPHAYSLTNYPNPFNGSVRLEFIATEPGYYRIDLFNVLGRHADVIWQGTSVGRRTVTYDARGLSSGVYWARVWDPAGNRSVATAKLVLLK